MYTEDELLPVSALQHLVFCKRQWALIHLEQVWEENVLTIEGKQMHEKTDEIEREVRGDVITVRGLHIRSYKYGLVGKADVVEFIRISNKETLEGVSIKGQEGLWRPMPVEYKHGKPKTDICDEIQLCAQAMCLEEMLAVSIPRGALFYGKPRRRSAIDFTKRLRERTEEAAVDLHRMTIEQKTPEAQFEKKCLSCSLLKLCLPKTAGSGKSAKAYILQIIKEVSGGEDVVL
ncbi:MAG: CRISPR-associated protein Cas4 [Peptococcaceae bacterium]|jgi:CRISPR-associated exonuclease Cas4|nr:CRISPR-associated protein Cas4 [Peptococcaceae bacterium]